MKAYCTTVNPFGENVYILWNDDTRHAVVIDPGMMRDDERNMIAQFLRERQLQVTHVLLTHLHLDHACSARWLATEFGAPVCASALDATLGENLPQQVQNFHLKVEAQPLTIDQELNHGDIITVDDTRIQVIHTPGHTQGGLCFYLPNEGLLIAGDTIFNGSVGRTDLPGGDHEQLIDSILTRVITLPDDTVIAPGHGPTTTIADEKQHNPFL